MRILHVLPHPGGGAEKYIDMLERLPGLEHRRLYLSRGRTAGSAAVSVPLRLPGLWRGARMADIVHVHGDVASVIGLPALRARPSVMTTHGLHMTRRLTGPAGGLMHSALRASVAACGAVICTSEAERSELTALIEAKGTEKLLVVHNGVDAPPAISAEEREAIRRELGVDSEAVLALFVGQLEPRKAPLLAARAVTRARDAGCKLVLAVAGDGPQRAELHSLAGPGVRPLGYRDDVDRLLAAADLFLAPAEREGMSLALLSALRRGLVVVAADGPGNPEAVGDAGLMFGVGDEDALVAELVRAVGDAGLRHSLSAQAVARAEERFGSERFLAATAEVYRRVGAGLTAPDRAASATNV